jgi:ABC-type polysaccharide/polyol phosphate transport system ATPase subunit
MMKAINLENVSKQYHKKELFLGRKDLFWALKNINFTLEKGETVGVVGQNGAGKTTLMRLISGITIPTKGKVEINGRVVPLITVEGALNFILSAKENMFLLATALGVTDARERKRLFEEVIEFSGLGDYLDMQIVKYSQGMKSRLAFSIAAHVPSDILLIDEVLAVGDEEFQKKCLNKIMQFKNNKKTIIFISHNMNDIKNICDRTIWINKGEIIKDASADNTIKTYLDYLEAESK